MSSTFEEFMKSTITSCTHTHTCNPPGSTATSHTHTCHHSHTQVFTPSDDDDESADPKPDKKNTRKPLGNREAVRKYREKKKAHTLYLEEEVKKLRNINQQLLKRLQGQAQLEAELARLRGLLFDVKSKIDCEIGDFPFQKQCGNETGGLQCDHVAFSGWEESCGGPVVLDCQKNQNFENEFDY
ncbi:hypothetical protein LUZ60_011169 [Juncus effusus]|nr:hypothetical protein LUZ60_011169 [Juncus effusus]